MWWHEPFFKYAVGIALVLLIIFLLYNTYPVLYPLMWFIAAILLPVLFATLLYYILRPLVDFLDRWMPRYLSILATYLILVLLGIGIALFVVPIIQELIDHITQEKIEVYKLQFTRIVEMVKSYIPLSNFPIIENVFLGYVPKIQAFVYQLTVNFITTLASIAISLALTPFVLYYFLRDDELFGRFILRFTPSHLQEEVQKILHDVDSTLSEFITAQLTLALIVSGLLFCGYILIGLPHALELSLIALLFYVVPFLGTFIAIIPALIVGFSISISMAVKVVIVMFGVHFIDSNLLTPRLMSHRLNIHPLTIILLLLAAGTLYGLLGLLLVTPTYAILKVVVWNIYKISRLRYTIAKSQNEHEPTPLPS
jgi:predicted PurR-regulated permease PerM